MDTPYTELQKLSAEPVVELDPQIEALAEVVRERLQAVNARLDAIEDLLTRPPQKGLS